jgi:hypothetical protein
MIMTGNLEELYRYTHEHATQCNQKVAMSHPHADTWEGSKAGGVCARRLGLGPGPFTQHQRRVR